MRYNYIAIEGNIGAGKTCLSTMIAEQFNGKLILEQFEDNSFFTVAIQGWGFISTLKEWKQSKWVLLRSNAISPFGVEFTSEHFIDLVERYDDKEKDSIKTFFTNGRSVAGIGNSYLQDILFRAKVNPKRKVADITASEKKALYRAVKDTIDPLVLRSRTR